jgi:hypothetical protein
LASAASQSHQFYFEPHQAIADVVAIKCSGSTSPAWSSFAHALVMAIQAFQNASHRGGLLGAAATFVVIGGAMIVLARGSNQSSENQQRRC